MRKLDQLKWEAGFAQSAYGMWYGVRSSHSALIPSLQERLPPGSKRSDAKTVDRMFSVILGGRAGRKRNYNLLYWNHSLLARTHDLDDVLHTFQSYVRLGVAELSRKKVFVHAGVVGWNGRAILIPGKSFSGKTSLVAELVKAGAHYLSDEYAVIGEDGCIEAFPKPLSFRDANRKRLSEVPVGAFGGRVASGRWPIGLVVVTHFKPHASWRPQKLSPGHGMLVLLQNTVSARRAPDRAMAALESVIATAEMIKSPRGEAAEVAERILKRSERNFEGE